jgi:ABC-type sugar transport system, periplasmic component
VKKFVAIFLMILMAGAVFGCTDVDVQSGDLHSGAEWSDVSLPAGVSIDENGNPVAPNRQIVIWADPEDDSVKAAIEGFKRKRPDVEVKLENNSTVNIEAIQRAFSSGQAPDIIRLDHVYITGFGRNGDLLDLNKYGAGDIAPKFVDACMTTVSHNGAIYGIPGDASTIAFMYNQDMLNAAGKSVSDLATYEGVKETARAMKAAEPAKTPITFTFPDNGYSGWNPGLLEFLPYLWSEGGDVLSPDLRTAAFNQQPGIDALNKLLSFHTENLARDLHLEREFYRGEVGMIHMGCWAIPSLVNNMHGQNLGVTTMPVQKQGVPGYSGLGMYAWGVTKIKAKTKEPRSEEMNQACFDFLENFLTDDALQVSWARKNNFLPTTKAALGNSYFTSNEVWNVFAKQVQITKSRPGVTNWLQIEGYLHKAINEAVTTKNVPNALNNAAKWVDDLLK